MNSLVPAPAELEAWRAAAARGQNWLVEEASRTHAFGQPDADFNWFAKVPWCLAGSGRHGDALRLLTRMERGLQDGSLRWPQQTEWTNAAPYALGWMVSGARLCERFRFARWLYQQLQSYVCPSTNAIESAPPEQRARFRYFDISIQGAAMHAALFMGDLNAATCLGDFVNSWLEKQPESPQLFTHFHPDLGYLTDFTEDNRAQRVFSPEASRQPFANLGFVLQGLIRTSEATGDPRFLSTGRKLLDQLLCVYSDDLLKHSQNHKVGHAAILLFRDTGDEVYLQAGLTIARRVAQSIQSDGRALADVFYHSINEQPAYTSVRTTCDSVLWLQQITDELESMT